VAAGRKPIASFYSPKEYQEWQKEAAQALKSVPAFPLDGPCEVSIICEAAKPKTTKLPHPKWDVDNAAKSVLDAITKDGRFWADDSQVALLKVTKRWTEGEPGISVQLAPCEPHGSSL